MTKVDLPPLETCDLLGLPVTSGLRAEVAAALAERITAQIRTRIAFVNAHLSNLCGRDPTLRNAVGDFLLLNDGIGLDLARRVLHGRAFVDNLNGTDFLPLLLDQPQHSWRIFLFGGRQDVVTNAARRFRERWPHHVIVGCADGYCDVDSVATRIAASRAELVLVATGNPRQEEWIAQYTPSACRCAIAVGAWFDFLTGRVPRAPLWVRRLRCEWIFRLCREPRRLAGRYTLGNAVFLGRVLTARLGAAVVLRRRKPVAR